VVTKNEIWLRDLLLVRCFFFLTSIPYLVSQSRLAGAATEKSGGRIGRMHKHKQAINWITSCTFYCTIIYLHEDIRMSE